MAKYTDKLLKTTLLDLMEKKKLNDITVVELIRVANVNRKTFYNHYRGMSDLLCKILSEECVEAVHGNTHTDNWEIGVKNLMLAIKARKEFLVRIMESDYSLAAQECIRKSFDSAMVTFVQSAQRSLEKREGCTVSLTRHQEQYLAHYYSSVLFAMLKEWFGNGMKEEIEDCIHFLDILTNNGVYEGIRFFNSNQTSYQK